MKNKLGFILLILITVIFGQTLLFEHIPNAYAASAKNIKEIEVNQNYTETIASVNSENWYSFKTTKHGYFNIDFSKKSYEIAKFTITVYNKDFEELNTYSLVDVDSLTTMNYGFGAGTFYLKVIELHGYGFIEHEGTYNVKINNTNTSNWEMEENNNSFSDCNTINLSNRYYGTLYKQSETDNLANSDSDYYKFKTVKNGCVTIDFEKEASRGKSWHIDLYDSSKKYITTFVTSDENVLNTKPYYCKKGTYYLRVYEPYNSLYSSATYNFRILFTAKKNYEAENNKSFSLANKIILSKSNGGMQGSITGSLWDNNDIDCYSINLDKKRNVTIIFSHFEEDGKRWIVSLSKADGTLIESKTNTTSSDTFIYDLAKGTYYIKVIPDTDFTNSNSANEYNVSVTVK